VGLTRDSAGREHLVEYVAARAKNGEAADLGQDVEQGGWPGRAEPLKDPPRAVAPFVPAAVKSPMKSAV
jgi:hypothetical protein